MLRLCVWSHVAWMVTCARAARALRLYQAEKLNVAPRYAIGLM